MNLEEVWNAIDAGQTVCWNSATYEVLVVDSMLDWRKEQRFEVPFSNRDGKSLRVTCVSNYFGSLLSEADLNQLFIKETK